MSGPRLMDDSIEAIRRRHETSVVWAEGEVTVRVSDALWRAKKDIGLLLEARAAAVAPLEKALRDADLELDAHGCEYESIRAPIRALISAPSPVREPEGLDVLREVRAFAIQRGNIVYSVAEARSQWETLIEWADHRLNATPERPADEVDG